MGLDALHEEKMVKASGNTLRLDVQVKEGALRGSPSSGLSLTAPRKSAKTGFSFPEAPNGHPGSYRRHQLCYVP